MGWNDLAVTRPSTLVDGLDGQDVYFAHSFAVEPTDERRRRRRRPITTAASSPPSSRAPSPASSFIPSEAQLRAPASSRTRWHGQEARDPLPRRRRRTRRQGRELRRPPRDGRADRARHPLLGARRRRARLPRHHGHARGPRADPRADRAGGGGADDPVHGRRRRHRPRRCALAAACRAPTRSRSTGPPSTTRRSSPRSPTSSAPRPSSARSTRRPGRSSPTPARTPRGRDAVDWAIEAVERGAGELLVTSIDADGTRAGYDLPLTRAFAEAVEVPVIASGGAGEAAHLGSCVRRREPRRRSSPRSCTSGPSGCPS